jgi:hypothetical protein
LLSIAALASIVTTIGRLSDIIESPKSAKISGGTGLPPIANELRTSSSGSAAKAATGNPEQSANTRRTRRSIFMSSTNNVLRQDHEGCGRRSLRGVAGAPRERFRRWLRG